MCWTLITDDDSVSKRLFVTDGSVSIKIIDFSDPENLTKISTIDLSAYGMSVNSATVKNGIVAIAVEVAVATAVGLQGGIIVCIFIQN